MWLWVETVDFEYKISYFIAFLWFLFISQVTIVNFQLERLFENCSYIFFEFRINIWFKYQFLMYNWKPLFPTYHNSIQISYRSRPNKIVHVSSHVLLSNFMQRLITMIRVTMWASKMNQIFEENVCCSFDAQLGACHNQAVLWCNG